MREARSVIFLLLLYGITCFAQSEELAVGGAGGSLVFYRPGDYIAFENFQTSNTSLLTIEFWLKSRSFSPLFTPISYATPGMGLRFAWLGEQGIRWMGQDFLFANPGSIGTINQGLPGLSDVHSWHHYAIVWSGLSGIFQFYIDGELWATAFFESSKGNVFESGGTLVIGQLQTNPGRGFDAQYSFQGMIDELRVWSTLRTRAEIREWMNYPLPSWNTTGLISYYDFDSNRTSNNQLTDVLNNNTGSFGYWDLLNTYTLNASATVSPVIGPSTAPVVIGDRPAVFYVDVDSGRNIYLPYMSQGQFMGPGVNISITRMPSNNIYQYVGGTRVYIPTVGPIVSSTLYFDPVQLIFPDAKYDSFEFEISTANDSASGVIIIVANQQASSMAQTARAFQQADKVINLICYDINGNDLQPVITALPTSGAIYHLPNATVINKSMPIVAVNTRVNSPINSVAYTPVSNLRNFQDSLSFSCALRGSNTWSATSSQVFITVELSSQRPLAGSGLWALEFNGINNYAVTNMNLTQINALGTVSAWVRIASNNPEQTIITGVCDNGLECLRLYISYSNSTFQLCMSMLSGTLSVNTLCEVIPNMQTTYWTHVAATISPEVTIYSNGSILATKSLGSLVFLPKQLVLGAGWAGNQTFTNYFSGRMDEVRIWQVPVQVATTMRSRTAEDNPLLVAYWDFNNGLGETTPDVTKQGIRTLWSSNSTLNVTMGAVKRSTFATFNATTNYTSTVDPMTNAFLLGGGFAAFQPSYVVSDGPGFNTHTTREDEPILLRLDASSLLFSSVARVITALPQKGVLCQVSETGEFLFDKPINDPYLSWDVRYPIEQWVSNVLNFSSFDGDYLNSSYSPFKLIGRPSWYDSPNPSYGDSVNSWAPEWPCINQTADDWIDLEYDTAVFVYSIEVCENLNPGMVTSLSAFNLDSGQWSTLWQGQATVQAPSVTIWAPSICEPLFPTNRIRLTLNACASPGPTQIAGVKLIGSVDPRRGVLTNDEGYVLYVPNQHVNTLDGDTFQYKTIDCPFDRNRESQAVMKTIIITPQNNPPLALAQNVSLNESISVIVQLTHEDIDGDTVTYLIKQLPKNGELAQVDDKDSFTSTMVAPGLLTANTKGRVRYTPPRDTCGMGLDKFTFSVSDKELTSSEATITLNVYCLPGAHIVSDVLFYVFFAIAILLGVISIGFIVVVGVLKDKQEFRMASPMLLIVMLAGFVLCLTSVYFFAGPLTEVFCHLRVWLLSLGFALIIGTMFVKTYRIWRIFCNKTLKRRQLSDRWLLFILVAFILVDIGVLIVFSLVGTSTVESYPSPFNPAATIQKCKFNYIIFYSLFGYKGLLLLFTVFLCFMIWNVKPAMPDFTALSVAVFTFAVCGLILIPIMLIITEADPNPTAVFLGPALATIVPIAITLAVVFIPKTKEVYKNRNKQSDMEFNLQINTTNTVTTVSKQTNVSAEFDDPAENKSVIELLETIKQKDDQIERLKNILAKKKYKIRSLKQRLIEAKQNQEPPSRSNMQSSEHS